MRLDYYVYYRIDPSSSTALADEVRRAQEELARRTGVQGRLMRRADDEATWMEVYQGVERPDPFEQALAALVESHRLARFLASGANRHTERFVECA